MSEETTQQNKEKFQSRPIAFRLAATHNTSIDAKINEQHPEQAQRRAAAPRQQVAKRQQQQVQPPISMAHNFGPMMAHTFGPNGPNPHHHQQYHQHQQQQQQQQQQQHQHQHQHQHQQHQQHQQQQQQQQQQAAYNVYSSDYSSSTYHVYDQILGDHIIDDLIIIKQERMKKKHEQEQRRKVILFSLSAILLVGLLMFLLFQLLKVTQTPPSTISSQIVPTPFPTAQMFPQNPPVSLPQGHHHHQGQNYNRPAWAPPVGGEDKYNWPNFVPTGQFGVRQLPPSSPSIVVPNSQMKISPPQRQPFVPVASSSSAVAQLGAASSSTTSAPIVIMSPSMANIHQPNPRNQPTLPPPPPTANQQQQVPQAPSNPAQKQQQQPPVVSSTVTTATSDSNNSNLRGCHGKHCNPTSGCPNQCSGRGHCVKVTPASAAGQQENMWLLQQQTAQQLVEWRCQCPAGTTGDDCGILTERQCDDGLDNDKDGLVDCADSECCSDIVCQNSTLCMKSPDPLDILMRKPPLPPTSSFFQRMHFLIEKFSSQIYSKLRDFSDSQSAGVRNVDRASVIRGRVTYQKQGVTGVRVSIVGQTNLGITLSRDGGYFDLMVNGGGVILVEFKREPFATFQKAVRVPWNEIVLVDQVELQLASSQQQQPVGSSSSSSVQNLETSPTCLAHNYQLMRPQVTTSLSRASSPSSKSLEVEQQVVHQTASGKLRAVITRDSIQQSLSLPQSASSQQQQRANDSLSIVYISSKAREFMSTINIQLTPLSQVASGAQQQIAQELKQVHLKIVVEGVLFEQTFEPRWNLSFTYAWNRQNVYRQKSFGLSTASVSIGYEYTDCKHIIWSSHNVRLMGHDLPISEIGAQWSLNVHHRYNYRDSILQRGDGQNFHLKLDRPHVVQALMGDGYPRQPSCPFCDGATSPSEQKLLRPQALVSGPDGSLYVGDHNMIRRIEPPSVSPSAQAATSAAATSSGSASSSSASSMQASLSASSAERAVRTVLEMNPNRVPDEYSLALNLAPAEAPQLHLVDTSHRQVLLVREQRPAAAPAATPSSRAADDSIYETTPPSGGGPDDLLLPVVGTGEQCQPDDRLSCGDGQPARAARLIEPRAAAFDLEGRMYLADGPNVRLVDLDQKIYTILGDYSSGGHQQHRQRHLLPCTGEPVAMHKFRPRAPRDLAFNPADETLHVLDENVVYRITQDKRVQVVAGRPAHCAGASSGIISDASPARATEVGLQSARSIAFSATGELFIGEEDGGQQNGRVLLVEPELGTISLYAGQLSEQQQQQQQQHESATTQLLLGSTKQRASNALAGQQAVRASEHKFHSVAALAVDQQGNLLVADRAQLRVVAVEPDLPQLTAAGEYEIQSPEQPNELLVFNRHGLQVATREALLPAGGSQFQLQLGQQAASSMHTKYTFAYNVNTSYGLLASVSYATGNKVSIYRDAPHHNVKLIETAFGGQCKLEMTRNGQVQSVATSGGGGSTSGAPNSLASAKFVMSYHEGSGLLKQTRDQMTGEQLEFGYDEFGRALSIQQQV